MIAFAIVRAFGWIIQIHSAIGILKSTQEKLGWLTRQPKILPSLIVDSWS